MRRTPRAGTAANRDGEIRLSKSRFCAGLQCLRRLWWQVHEPEAPELQPGAALQLVFDRGHRVGELARERFPGGVLVEFEPWRINERVEATRRALEEGAGAIFEASFSEKGVFAALDVLERGRRGFALVEVKSTLDAKPEHIPDMAVQLFAARAAGLDVRRAEVMHLNRECAAPDLSNLFQRSDVTGEAEALQSEIPGHLRRMQAALAGPLPEVEPGDRCSAPYDCPFTGRCCPELPEHHLSTIYRLSRKRLEALLGEGYQTILDLPEGITFPAAAGRQVRSVKSGRLVVEPGLGRALSTIAAPVAHLDFETVNPAIPVWKGCHPYQAVPVQMSCHRVGARGKVEHFEHLAEGAADPRPGVAEAVIRACDGAATVVAYNASFEARCLDHLADAVPRLRSRLLDVKGRLVDLLPIVQEHVYHPKFGGSFSLKSVVPALVPELAYDDLEVAEGATASAILESLLLGGEAIPAAERAKLRAQLLAYCKRDTQALLRIAERLREMAG